MKNKKAAIMPIWIPGLVVITLLVLITAVIYLNAKIISVPRVGDAQQKVFETAVTAEKALLYIDSAALLSAKQAIIDAAFDGGYAAGYAEEKCGIYRGFSMWTTKDAECYPSAEDVKRDIISQADADLKAYFSNYNEIELSADYRYSILSPKFTIVGSALNNMQIEVSPLLEVVKIPVIEVPVYEEIITKPAVKYVPPKTAKEALANIYRNYGSQIKQASAAHNNVPEEMIAAIIMMESSGNPNAMHEQSGCKGIAQFCGATAYQYGLCDCVGSDCGKTGGNKRYCVNQDDRLKPDKSIDAEAHYLGDLLDKFKGYTDKNEFAIASYNVGYAVVIKAIKKTNKPDPRWNEVAEQMTPDLVTYFKTYSEQAKTVATVKQIYIPKITGYEEAYASLPQEGVATG